MKKVKINLQKILLMININGLLFASLFLIASCSRESGIAQNPLLKDGHIQIFILTQRPADMNVFLDSIQELNTDSIKIKDTVAVTVKDTVFLIGRFFGLEKKIRNYYWVVNDSTYKDRKNSDLLPVVFDHEGYYQASFVAQDRLGQTMDTAGQYQYIQVIDTRPLIHFNSDTGYTSHEGPGTFTFYADDSCGLITTIRVDSDADGKWDSTFQWQNDDSIRIEIPLNTKMVDSLGNQKALVEVEDDDGNTTQDSLVMHFNRIPSLYLDYPDASSKVSIFQRFAFYWHADDSDNPRDLVYFLRVGKVPTLTNSHLVISNTSKRTWEQVDTEGVLTDSSLHGNLYWQVWATDGYDTVESEVRKFYLGDPNIKFASMHGTAIMQGQTGHNGIRITLISLSDGSRILGNTNASGLWEIQDIVPDCYRIEAMDTVGLYYSPASMDSVCVELGDDQKIDTLLLRDQSRPAISLQLGFDSLYTTRDTILWSGAFGDSGSFVNTDSVFATLDHQPFALTSITTFTWSSIFTGLSDGRHFFTLVVKDRAGNVSDTLKMTFRVLATQVALTVNGQGAAVVVAGDSLHFRLHAIDPNPPVDSIIWMTGDGDHYRTLQVQSSTDSVFTLDTVITQVFKTPRQFIAVMKNDSGFVYRDTVQYRVRDAALAAVLFIQPATDTTVTINDTVSMAVQAEKSELATQIVQIDWDVGCDGSIDHTGGETDTTWNFVAGTQSTSLCVTVTDDNSPAQIAYDTLLIHVITDPPTVHVLNQLDTVKINGDIHLNATANDRLGTIEKIEWNCGSQWNISPTTAYTAVAPAQADTLLCIIRVTDDDGESAQDTTIVYVLQDIPSVQTLKDSMTVTIRDTLKLQAQATDALGSITNVAWSCGIPGIAGISGWKTVAAGINTTWIAPDSAVSPWYCVIRVTDDDAQTAMDTIQYSVLLDRPTVTVMDDSLLVTIGDQIDLDAIASDSLGSIILYEWSCGGPGVAGQSSWKTYPSPVASVLAPASGNPNYLCVIRIMDDDSLYARDTTFITVDQDEPQVVVTHEKISVRINENFQVDCNANDKLGDIQSYEWSCGAPGVAGNHWDQVATTWYYATAPSTATLNYLCIIRVTDNDNLQAKDTVHVIVVEPPEAIIATSDSLVIWSGDLLIADQYRYWDQKINASSSTLGSLGDQNHRQFWWNFSHYMPGSWFLGPEDGTIDRSYTGFDIAFQRDTVEGAQITVTIDFRDSTLPSGEIDSSMITDFYIRHLDTETKTITFYRAWKNVGTDTVVESGGNYATAMTVDKNNHPVVFYRDASGAGKVQRWNGSSWAQIGSDIASSVDSVRLAIDTANGDLYAAFRNATGDIEVHYNAGGSGSWVQKGTTVIPEKHNALDIAIAASHQKIYLAWIDDNEEEHLMQWLGSDWGYAGTLGASYQDLSSQTTIQVELAVSGSGDTIAFAAVQKDYKGLVSIKTPGGWGSTQYMNYSASVNGVSITWAPNGKLLTSFNDRNNNGPGVMAYSGNHSWTRYSDGSSSTVGLHLVGSKTHIIADAQSRPILTYDDNFFSPQVSVWRYDSSWDLLGESQLPYFASRFQKANGYRLTATGPTVGLGSNGNLFVSMTGIDSRAGGVNNGPIVMQYHPASK